jgi:hypothetical protein
LQPIKDTNLSDLALSIRKNIGAEKQQAAAEAAAKKRQVENTVRALVESNDLTSTLIGKLRESLNATINEKTAEIIRLNDQLSTNRARLQQIEAGNWDAVDGQTLGDAIRQFTDGGTVLKNRDTRVYDMSPPEVFIVDFPSNFFKDLPRHRHRHRSGFGR